jgi:hypothetical protein
MVNTFLVRGNYVESARLLNKQRLGKQRVEAQQILTALEQLRFVASRLNLPAFPENTSTPLEDRANWISTVVKTFNVSWQCVWIQGPMEIWVPHGVTAPHKPTSTNLLFRAPDGRVIETKPNKDRTVVWIGTDCVMSDDQHITMGFKSHAATKMWLGLEPSLRLYITAVIEEWIRRGCENNMRTYPPDPTAFHPTWATDDSPVVRSHKANLIWKEITRAEPRWYQDMPDFVACYQPHPDYIWP